ncbi:aromatic ring-hydroxylating dioxygenase subunit alpha [Reyranella sp. CPCC 100927]|uniref:aromatic ring-hydroxylating oxygenase subunit alpha n=1 Tax=Reyranella sp. CPCC 100927 TaxID=2599616 RepID=UPI0011B565E0|nr:aromatic ring-hydroxylating dioxygenase subunit alpha [Reyranella sp. CPCC 100927]TWT15220.1 aromatic ring-hydroxylating dioxygenase subunit alpha [Reyranella sp. CPCC 100927]
MRHERQIELLDRLVGVDPNLPWTYGPTSMRNPASAYTDPARFAREKQVLFRDRPQLVGLSGECTTPGAYLTANLGGVPIVVVRQTDGSLRAMVNVCRHRGATLLEGRGTGGLRRIVCPYHAWTYNTDGQLVHRPAAAQGFDDVTVNCDLHQRAVAEKHGLIFVHPTSTEPFDVDTLLCGLGDDLADYGLADYVHVETRTNSWKMNWKMVLDTFTEAYHIRFLHKATIAPYFLCDLIFDAFGPHSRTIGLRKSVVEQIKDKPRSEWKLLPYSTTQYFLVPNALLVYQLDHIELWRLTPIDVNTVEVATSIFAPEPPKDAAALNHWTKNLDILLKVTETEDFQQMVRIQKNLESGALPELVYGRIEPALVHLHTAINAAVAESVR